MASEMLDKIRDTPGFATGVKLSPGDLERVRGVLVRHLADQLKRVAPEKVDELLRTPLELYHTISDHLPHTELLTRTQRILPQWAVDEIRQTSLIKDLEAQFGNFEISDEEGMSREGISIRVVRPDVEGDVGSLHTDDWFWKLYNFKIPEGKQRIKVWAAICCEPGKSGLLLSPNSHIKEWRYTTFSRSGMLKPLLDPSEKPRVELFNSQPGDAVVFNYRLLHGGAVTRGSITRVSLEFTILIPAERYLAIHSSHAG